MLLDLIGSEASVVQVRIQSCRTKIVVTKCLFLPWTNPILSVDRAFVQLQTKSKDNNEK